LTPLTEVAGLPAERQKVEYELISHLEGMNIHAFLVTIHRRKTHYHSDTELFIPIEGAVSIHVGKKSYSVGQNDFFIVNAYEPHSLSSAGASNALLVLQFNPNFAREYFPGFSAVRILEPLITRESMPRLHQELLRGMQAVIRSIGRKETGYPLALVGELNRLAYAILRFGAYDQHPQVSLTRGERSRARIMNVIAYIQEHYSAKPSLAELARQEGLEPSYLSHFIRNVFGMSFREYVNRLRLEHAVMLITGTDLRTIDICLESGFSDHRYLNKALADAFRMSPAAVREAFRGQKYLQPWSADKETGREHDISTIAGAYSYILDKLASIGPPDTN
jgi:AraC-like DNA-binding protein/mannose-6-phosphate isomerase-like protein (cupin superfamily)